VWLSPAHKRILRSLKDDNKGSKARDIINAARISGSEGAIVLRELFDAGYVECRWEGEDWPDADNPFPARPESGRPIRLYRLTDKGLAEIRSSKNKRGNPHGREG